ncbi:lipopolysaccharide biosynthesis protein [Rhodopirellula sp. JC639]|uniref:lipopolysaccharide biosynthesis protein n=1 Tax=Stieleria mannarensis TaxID=2755585 RepID=UPI001600F837|nr:hypothetical protein [Rhodopirellula sp. JC639]
MKAAEVSARLRGLARGDTMLSLLDQVIVSGTRFATTVMVGRFGSESELGYYSLAFSVFVLLVGFQESLISIPYTVFVKRLSPDDQRKYGASSLAQAIGLNLIAMLVLLIACVLIQTTRGATGMIGLLWLLVALLPFLMLREFARRMAFAQLHVPTAMALDLAVSVLQLGGLAALALADQMTAGAAFLVTGIATGLSGLIWLTLVRSSFQWDRSRMRSDWVENIRFGKWVTGAQLTSVLQTYFAHWLLAAVIDERATGIYAACMTVVMLSNPFILGMSNVLSPKAAHAFAAGGAAAAAHLVWRFTGVMLSILCVFAALVGVFGNAIVVWIFDQQYGGHGAAILVLASGTIALGAGYSFASGLRAINRPAANFWAGIWGLVVTVVISSALVHRASILGTSLGLVSGFYVTAIYRLVAFRAAIVEMGRSEDPEGASASS